MIIYNYNKATYWTQEASNDSYFLTTEYMLFSEVELHIELGKEGTEIFPSIMKYKRMNLFAIFIDHLSTRAPANHQQKTGAS